MARKKSTAARAAKPAPTLKTSPLTPGISYNTRARRYVDGTTKKFISGNAVRAALDRAIDQSASRLAAASVRFNEGKINLPTWQVIVAQETKLSLLASMAAANGGWAQLTASHYGRVGAEMKKQLGYLDRFARQIETGEQKQDGTLVRRAKLYAHAGRSLYHKEEGRIQKDQGKTRERNVLGASDHCPGCLAQTARGWVKIGTLIPVGQRDCLTLCHCTVEYD